MHTMPYIHTIMACLSELAYYKLDEYEIANHSRYKLFNPSLALSELAKRKFRIELTALRYSASETEGDGLIRIQTRTICSFVYQVAISQFAVVIAIRGTLWWRLRDWAVNLSATKTRDGNLHFHSGFWEDAKEGINWLKTVVPDDKPVYMTGHSLGAAVAALITFLWKKDGNICAPYLFAPPRFANRQVSKDLSRHSYVNRFDVVPHLPPRFCGYSDEGGTRCHVQSTHPSRLPLKAHAIESYRHLLASAGEKKFGELALLQAIMAQLKEATVRDR